MRYWIAVKFLLSYLLSRWDGRIVRLPQVALDGVLDAIRRATERGSNVVHSTDYEGRGFWGRPIGFYLVGGFAFEVYTIGDHTVVYFEDRYDWHPGQSYDGGEMWFTSPLPGELPGWLARPLDWLFGRRGWFTVGFGGELAISNKLWADLGGGEFTTYAWAYVDDIPATASVNAEEAEEAREIISTTQEIDEEWYLEIVPQRLLGLCHERR